MPENDSIHYDVVIIGAGAAGLMCAATAAGRGKNTIVLDHANKMAKKVLMSGGGKCNFTNMYVEPENFLSQNPHFCKSALSRYTQWDFISLVDKYGIEYYEKELGQLFCKQSSKEIRDLLLNECQKVNARIQLKCDVLSVKPVQDGFTIDTSLGQYKCNSLIIATGGLSIPTMGASGFGYQIAEQFGHKIVETGAGLTPLTFKGKLLQQFIELAGNSARCRVSCGGQSFTNAVLFTHKGLSGPAILQISNYWKKGDYLEVNWMPDLDIDEWLSKGISQRPEALLRTLLATEFSQTIANFICRLIGFDKKLKQIDHKEKLHIINLLENWRIFPDDVEGYRVAEVTLGGVDTSEISSKTFESQRQSGLYFIGEVLDVTGHLGGFNFQWAWASGYAAGQYV
ncbi:MAG: NAD(P)/FAD-dependent oxidoreductase [Kangiellaceae bacterium]|nr:NAD(P)/FAD-dependent oxidoreductase [Kangiellaceae bacterium]MCW9000715.1 NAD(P)/FAD-dependent oxidoreductase [Kangiellaceae bacterium]MCW9018301.1 NAD(P)/FAD-dependent oxidoreductase [Kangiellaceae bacterium]